MNIFRILTTLPASDFNSYWSIVVQIVILCALLLFSNMLRRKVKFIQKSLIPTTIIAGFLGLGIKYLLNNGFNITIDGTALMTSEFMSIITYHMIAIGFIALGLKGSEKLARVHEIKQVNPVKSGMLIVNTYVMQGIIGLLITIMAAFVFNEIAPFSGILLPMGYGQGPGQANNIGLLYENAGFAGGRSFGLTISTMGFIAAAIGGVIYLNVLVRKGKIKPLERTDVNKPTLTSVVEGSDEIPVVESVDKMSIQTAIVGLVYLITWLFMLGLTYLLTLISPAATSFVQKSVIPLIWGFNFIVATFMTILVKKFVKMLKKVKLMKRTYTNDFMLNRIAGVAFDFMIIASITAIDIETISSLGMIVTLIVIGIVGAVTTYFYIRYVTKRVYKGYPDEAFLAFYGNLTGTVSTGISILREMDPNFDTPASNDLVVGSTTAIAFGFPILLITGFIYNEGWYWLYGSLAALFVFFFVFQFFLMRRPREKKAPEAESKTP
jgi:ESS family glutamate:Na+ symporter